MFGTNYQNEMNDKIRMAIALSKQCRKDEYGRSYFLAYILYDDNGRTWGLDNGLGVYLFSFKETAILKQLSLKKKGEIWTVGEYRLYKVAEYHVANGK